MDLKKLAYGLAAAVPICSIIRILQIVFLVEYQNGFYFSGKGFLGNLCLVLIALICGALAFFTYKIEKISVIIPKRDWVLAVASVIVSITLFRELFGENMPMTMLAGQLLLLKLSTAFTAVYFLIFALKCIISFKMPPLLHIMPVIYAIIKTVFSFINLSSLALISDNVLLLASYCGLMLFFISYGKIYNGIKEKGFKKYLATSVVTIVITITASLPNLIINIIGKEPYIHTNTNVLITLLAFGIFAIVFTYKILNKKEHI